ncbi:MAG: BrnT family toxin [Kiritimatiellae bacterium]|nr:BrnT family toxin [Kiritimatiellia bacterium]
MKFEWDEEKNNQNITKHGIDFRDVVEMFHHPMLTQLDTRRDYGEDRWIGIGLLKNIVAVTVFLEWEDEETIRIISARKATRHESKEYHQRITY